MNKLFLGIAALALIVIIAVAFLPTGTIPVPSAPASLKQFQSGAELTAFLAKAQSSGSNYRGGAIALGVAESAAPQAASADKSYSTTNIQVAGVDEADIVKTDGTFLYTLANSKLAIARADPLEVVATLDAPSAKDLYLDGNKLIVLGTDSIEIPIEQLPEAQAGDNAPAAEKLIAPDYPYRPTKQVTRILIYSVADPAQPAVERNITIDGWYQSSRLIDGTVYVISSSPVYRILPLLAIDGAAAPLALADVYYSDLPDSAYEFTTILSVSARTDATQTKAILRGSSQQLYVSESNIYLAAPKQIDYSLLETRQREAIITLFPADVQLALRASDSAQAEQAATAYLDSLPAEEQQAFLDRLNARAAEVQEQFYRDADKTVINRIAIANGAITPEASGEVRGHPLNQFSFDEYNGHLRIATTTQPFGGWGWGGPIRTLSSSGTVGVAIAVTVSEPAPADVPASEPKQSPPAPSEDVAPTESEVVPAIEPSPIIAPAPEPPQSKNNVYTMRVSDLALVGSLEDLAPGERIYSARFLGDRAYLVTFVQVDPLFVIDLSDPAAPRVLGELKIPGYSDYLHPYDATHLIGIGKDAATTDDRTLVGGVKIALFDVSDVSAPRVIASQTIGDRGTESEALHDHHAFLFDRERNLLVLPIQLAEIPAEQRNDPWAYGKAKWQGAYVYRITESALELRGRVTHDPAAPSEQSWFDWNTAIRRSLFINDALYTLSSARIQANALDDLRTIATIDLPEPEYPNYDDGVRLLKGGIAE